MNSIQQSYIQASILTSPPPNINTVQYLVDVCLMPYKLSLSGEDIPPVEVLGVPGTKYVEGEPHCMHQVPRCLGVFIINLSKS